jgi:hypothetical protein
LLQRRKGQLHLPLDPGRSDDAKLGRGLDRPVQQRGLADARLTVHHQDTAFAAARGSQHAVEHLPLALSAEQLATR